MNAVLLGVGLGWIGSMPIGGPVSLFVVKRGVAGRTRDGVALAAGAAVAEAGYCAAALYGYEFLLDRWPPLRPVLAVAGALAMVALGIHFMLARHAEAISAERPAARAGWPRDFALGFTLVALNPAIVANWFAALAALHAVGLAPPIDGARPLLAGGVALGIVAWFSTLLWFLQRGRAWIAPVAFERVLRAFGGGLCALGLYTIYARFF